jgi:hypothetical protein
MLMLGGLALFSIFAVVISGYFLLILQHINQSAEDKHEQGSLVLS